MRYSLKISLIFISIYFLIVQKSIAWRVPDVMDPVNISTPTSAVELHEVSDSNQRVTSIEMTGNADCQKNKIYFGTGEHRLAYQFANLLTVKLMENRMVLKCLEDTGQYSEFEYLPEVNEFAIHNGRIRDVYDIKRDIAMQTVTSAFSGTVEETPIGKKIKKIEEDISKYFVVEYSKGVSQGKAGFYLPGQLTSDKMKEEKEYAVSLSSIFSADVDSLDMDVSAQIKFIYHRTTANMLYDFSKSELSFSLESAALDFYLGMNASFSLNLDKEGNTTSALNISVEF